MSAPKTLVISRDLTPAKIDEFASKLVEDASVIIRFGTKGVKHGDALGLESQLIQLFATWYRAPRSSKKIRTYIEDVSQDGFENLCQSISGMAFLTLCDEILLSDGLTPISKNDAFMSAVNSIEKISKFEFKEAYKGRKIFFPCLKPSKNNGQISPLYHRGKISSPDEFKYIIQECLKSVLGHKQFQLLGNKFLVNIGSCVYELFKNTEDHSLKDEKGDYFLKSVRSISVAVEQFDTIHLHEILGNNSVKYVESISSQKETDEKNTFLEISIVDTGIGYAKNWFRHIGKSLSTVTDQDEIEAMLRCFKKHNTTKNTSSSGTGLSTVITCLKELNAGFILRTGKTLTSWFSTDSSDQLEQKNIDLKNVELVGTSFSILIPLIFKDEE